MMINKVKCEKFNCSNEATCFWLVKPVSVYEAFCDEHNYYNLSAVGIPTVQVTEGEYIISQIMKT